MNQTKSKNTGRGGARRGAGRPAGSATKRTREIADKAMTEGVSPLEFMLAVMRSEDPEPKEGEEIDYRLAQMRLEMRFEAAKAAAPYIHPRLAAVEVSGDPNNPLTMIGRIELVGIRPSTNT
jgi:hypothetical protein